MKTPGSATRPGHLYHEPAFPTGQPFQRSNSDRWLVLLANEDWRGKTVVDFGCNAGFFSFRIALAGAKIVRGFDMDRDAIAFARSQAAEHRVFNVDFAEKDAGSPYFHEELRPDVVLLLSVVPWILKTEPNPWTVLRELFAAPVCYVELMYEGDGRAGMVGIRNDGDAEKWLREHFAEVHQVGWTTPTHNGGIRRTIWRCMHAPSEERAEEIVGSQATVTVGDRLVRKVGRSATRYDAARECAVLRDLDREMIAPLPVKLDIQANTLVMTRIQGARIGPGEDKAWLAAEADRICSALERKGIRHNDVRPENLIVGMDRRLYLVDFGWATWEGGPGRSSVPETINPDFRAATDRASFDRVIAKLC